MILMGTFGPKANAVLASSRNALRAKPGDRDRIEELLRARLGDAALPPDVIEPPPAPRVSWGIISGAAISACVLSVALFLSLRSQTKPDAPAPPVAPPTASAVTTVPSVPAPSTPQLDQPPVTAALPSAVIPATPGASAAPKQDPLSKEVALLSRATSALRAGRYGDALNALNQHQREFPHGALTEERRAAKAQVFCSMGRVPQGLAELNGLSAQSPAGTRARKVCSVAAEKASGN